MRITSVSPYRPRLGTIREVRKELVRVYREARRGEIDVQLIGRLVHCLNSLVAIDRDCGFEERLSALETALEQQQQPWDKNGHHHAARR
jgi:hypothetical protein